MTLRGGRFNPKNITARSNGNYDLTRTGIAKSQPRKRSNGDYHAIIVTDARSRSCEAFGPPPRSFRIHRETSSPSHSITSMKRSLGQDPRTGSAKAKGATTPRTQQDRSIRGNRRARGIRATYARPPGSKFESRSQFYRVNCIGVGRAESPIRLCGFFDRAEITFSDRTRAARKKRRPDERANERTREEMRGKEKERERERRCDET